MDHSKQRTIIIVEEIRIVAIIANENWNWMKLSRYNKNIVNKKIIEYLA
jgi:hypothetical protein